MIYYKILKNDYLDKLQEQVNEHLLQGYDLVGGVSADKTNNYLQALVLVDNRKKLPKIKGEQ